MKDRNIADLLYSAARAAENASRAALYGHDDAATAFRARRDHFMAVARIVVEGPAAADAPPALRRA